nr:unnamed protein product [Digitaria exilis]CAB3478497.1 unnamed protein product [Digitaria exilis]
MTLPPTLDQLREGGAAADIFRRPIDPTPRRAKTLDLADQRHQSHHRVPARIWLEAPRARKQPAGAAGLRARS